MFHVVVVVSHKHFPCNWPLLLSPFDFALMRTELFNVALRQIVVVNLSTLFVYRVKIDFYAQKIHIIAYCTVSIMI